MTADWKVVLADACKQSSQSAVARRIGYSAAVVSQVLKGSYKGDEHRVQQAVEGALMGLTVDCPVIGEIPRNVCLEYQRRAHQGALRAGPTQRKKPAAPTRTYCAAAIIAVCPCTPTPSGCGRD